MIQDLFKITRKIVSLALILATVAYVFGPGLSQIVSADDHYAPTPGSVNSILRQIDARSQELGLDQGRGSVLSFGPNTASFAAEDNSLHVRTDFDANSDKLKKTISAEYAGQRAQFTATLQDNTPFVQRAYRDNGRDIYSYSNDQDIFIYSQVKSENGDLSLKEWVSANYRSDSLDYTWDFQNSDPSRSIAMEANPDGSVSVYQTAAISGAKDADRKRVMESVRRALKDNGLQDRQLISRLEPAVYWTAQGERKQGVWRADGESVTLSIEEPQSSYPLLIDPTLSWGQWIGGDSDEGTFGLAVNGDEIYLVGYADDSANFDGLPFEGDYSGDREGFVVEIQDGETPTINWGQWLGGTGFDQAMAVAVNGDEIYVGGYVDNPTDMEGSFEGNFAITGHGEGYVVEIQDGVTPTINWGQWLGGDGGEEVDGLAVNGDQIYVSGAADSDANWELSFEGEYTNLDESYVLKMQDGVTPTLVWGQWLGGEGDDREPVTIAINGSELFIGGHSSDPIGWESMPFAGDYSGGEEGFVIKIIDNGLTPALVWGQWLGGSSDDDVLQVAVSGDEVYAAGVSVDGTDWDEVTFQGDYSGDSEGFVVEIQDGETPTINWGQWLGGTGYDDAIGLWASGDEIYVGGHADSDTDWETIDFEGTFDTSGWGDGYVVEIQDGVTPTINWGQWLGGIDLDTVGTVVVSGNEIFVAGDTYDDDSWAPTFYGTFIGDGSITEAFVVKMLDVDLNQDPDDPTSLGPTGLVDGSDTSDAAPTLEFTLSDPDGSDTLGYQIQIDDSSDFSSPIVDYASALGAQGASSFTVGQAAGGGAYAVGANGQTLADGSYYWRVKAFDNSLAESNFVTAHSGAIAFVVVTAVAPPPPPPPSSHGSGGGGGSSSSPTHPNGTLILDGQTVYLVKDGKRFGFRDPNEFQSYGYRFSQLVPANSADMKLAMSDTILKAMEGTLVLDTFDNRTVYMIGTNFTKRGFVSMEVLAGLGYNLNSIARINVSDYPQGPAIGDPSAGHPDGALILDGQTIWWIRGVSRQGFESMTVFNTYGFDLSDVVPANSEDMKLPEGEILKLRDGTLVRDSGNLFIISDGQKRQFLSASSLDKYGYNPSNFIDYGVGKYVSGNSLN
jgi:hypothetical protein